MNMDFYKKCAKIIGVDSSGDKFPYRNRTRWNNRTPGRGRFQDIGLIRKFGDKIHICLRSPISHHGIYNSEKEALNFLNTINWK
jgi:hypothetical protein